MKRRGNDDPKSRREEQPSKKARGMTKASVGMNLARGQPDRLRQGGLAKHQTPVEPEEKEGDSREATELGRAPGTPCATKTLMRFLSRRLILH